MQYMDDKLVVDELIIDPSLPEHVVVRIDTEFFMLSNRPLNSKVSDKDLRPYKKAVSNSWYRPEGSYNYKVLGLIPRGGYQVDLGRPITDKEFADLVSTYGLTEDDISDEFTDTAGAFYGPEYSKTYQAKQIRVRTTAEALEIERTLRQKGIEATNGSPDRVNIRVQSPKQ